MDQSFNDLKFQLQHELQKEGMVENMKTQLRYKLLERLQFQQKKIPTSDKISDSELLLKRVLASSVAEYLKENKFEYSLSVFVPETTFGNSLLSKDELKILLKYENTKQSVLQSIIQDILLIKPKEPQKQNAASQTYTGDAIINLEQKLNQVDDMYKMRIEGELFKPQMDMEERLLKLKKDYDQRLKAELSAETARIREFEVQNIRLDEADKYRAKMQEYREELEKNYQDKLNKLRERERDVLERSGAKTKELESLNYNYRQKIMKEHEYIKLKEQEIEKQRVANEESHKFQKAKLDVMESDLRRKLNDVNASEDQIKKRYEGQIMAAKASAENEFYEEREKIRQKQKQMEQDLIRLDQLKNQNAQLTKENQQIILENEKYVDQLRELKRNKKTIEIDYEALKENIRAVSDAQRRDQELSRKYETELRLKEDELALYKTTITHKEGMMVDHKTLHQEAIKKLQKELELYQQKVEQQELLIKEFQNKEFRAPFQIESTLFKGNIADSLLMGFNNNDHRTKLNQIGRELDENRLKRREEIKRLQEDAIIPINEQALKFENVWDPYSSSVNYSQSMQFQKNRNDDRDPSKIFQEDAQSQIMHSGLQQKKGYPSNIVEEANSDLI